MRQCPNCGRILSEDDFYKNKSRKDGLSRECKKCHNQRVYKSAKNKRLKLERIDLVPIFDFTDGVLYKTMKECSDKLKVTVGYISNCLSQGINEIKGHKIERMDFWLALDDKDKSKYLPLNCEIYTFKK